MDKKKIAFASDHAGFDYKQSLMEYVAAKGYEPLDFGTHSTDSCDYPDYAHPAARAVESGEAGCGIALCGTGEGMAMTLNKHSAIRAALCWKPEIAVLGREHNDANFLVMPARFISLDEAKAIVGAYLATDFLGGRHLRRIEKIPVGDCR